MFDRIKGLCDKNGTNITTLCKTITGSSGNIPTWKKGHIRSDYLLMVAEHFNVTTDYLLKGIESSLTADETNLLTQYRSMSDQGKEYILQTIDMAKDKYKKSDGASIGVARCF